MANLPSWNNARPKLWRAVQVLLIVGIASGVMKAFFSQPAAASWIGPAPEGPIGPVLRIGIWTGAFALCLFLVWLIPRGYGLLLQILVAVWRPLVLVIAAAWLLFCNDQGRELGVSLMGEHSALRIGSLFLALIYWAANNWHTARLGLRDAIQPRDIDLPQGDQNQYWLFWSPLLLGVCAHFLAAINLSLAAWTRPGFDVLAWTAPIFIILVTALACAFDRLYVWQRPIDDKPAWALLGAAVFAIVRLRPTPHDKRAWTLLRAALFAIIRHPPTRDDEPAWTLLGAIVVAIGLLGGIVWVALKTPPDLTGFLWGTIVTILSAIVYLIGVSCWLGRGNPSDDEEERINVRTIVLFSIACLFTFATLRDPVGVGSFFGSMVVAYFAFGAMLALVNFCEFLVHFIPAQRPGEVAWRRVVGVHIIASVILLAILNAWLHPFHRVRLCDGGDCVAKVSVDQRPHVADAAQAWYKQAEAAYRKAHRDGPVPMLIVATAGGGIRAAYWTATILERLETDFKAEGGVRPYLFAISGVSGGSVGAVAFEAALAQRDESPSNCKAGDCPPATQFLTEDFLAPALANLIFVDTPSSLLPDLVFLNDRGTAIEKSFERASGGLLAKPFLSFFRYGKDTAANEEQAPWWRPILLLNATHEETGKRIITGHVLIERNVFLDSLDALHVLGKDVRASTAAHNSARFTYVSPAGDLGNNNGSVIDGGYFENYGALSALELARAARAALKDKKVKLVILMISSDPSLGTRALLRINEARSGGKCLLSIAEREGNSSGGAGSPNYLPLDEEQVENAWVNEFLAPLQGIMNVRGAHGRRAAAELADEICAEFDESGKTGRAALASRSQKTRSVAATVDMDVNVNDSAPATARPNSPYFAHLAMCKEAPLQPPLGWVLSKATREHFKDLLENENCDNNRELDQLEIALGKEGPTQAAGGKLAAESIVRK